jgi:hypothetical protein
MEPGAIVGRVVAIGVGGDVGVPSGDAACDGGTGVGDGDFFGDGVGDSLVFFLGEALGEPFFLFLDGVGVFFAGFFFFGDVFAIGVADFVGVAEVSAAL